MLGTPRGSRRAGAADPTRRRLPGPRSGGLVQLVDPDELEAGLAGEVLVDVGVPDVDVAVGVEASPDVGEVVLAPHEVHLDAVAVPQLLLVRAGPIGGRPD